MYIAVYLNYVINWFPVFYKIFPGTFIQERRELGHYISTFAYHKTWRNATSEA